MTEWGGDYEICCEQGGYYHGLHEVWPGGQGSNGNPAFAEAIDAEDDEGKKKDLRENLKMLMNVKCVSDEGGSKVARTLV